MKNESETTFDLVREFFPEATDKFCNYVLWEHTGYMGGICNVDLKEGQTIPDRLREQIQEFKNKCHKDFKGN